MSEPHQLAVMMQNVVLQVDDTYQSLDPGYDKLAHKGVLYIYALLEKGYEGLDVEGRALQDNVLCGEPQLKALHRPVSFVAIEYRLP